MAPALWALALAGLLGLPGCAGIQSSSANCRSVLSTVNIQKPPSLLGAPNITFCVWRQPPFLMPASTLFEATTIQNSAAALPPDGTLVRPDDLRLRGFDVDYARLLFEGAGSLLNLNVSFLVSATELGMYSNLRNKYCAAAITGIALDPVKDICPTTGCGAINASSTAAAAFGTGVCCIDFSYPYFTSAWALLSMSRVDPEQLLKTLLSAEIVNSLLAGVLGVFAMGWLLFGLEVWRNPAISNIDQAVYLAVVTLTTVGFGDITPKSRLAKACISIWMILSVFFVATWTSLISTKLTTARLSAQNIMELKSVTDSICVDIQRPAALQYVLSYPTCPPTVLTGTLDDCVNMVLNRTVEAAVSDRGLLNWYVETYQLNRVFISSTIGTSTYSIAYNEGDYMREFLNPFVSCLPVDNVMEASYNGLLDFYFGTFAGAVLIDPDEVAPWLVITVCALAGSTVVVALSVEAWRRARRCLAGGGGEGVDKPPQTVMTHVQELLAEVDAVRELQAQQAAIMERVGGKLFNMEGTINDAGVGGYSLSLFKAPGQTRSQQLVHAPGGGTSSEGSTPRSPRLAATSSGAPLARYSAANGLYGSASGRPADPLPNPGPLAVGLRPNPLYAPPSGARGMSGQAGPAPLPLPSSAAGAVGPPRSPPEALYQRHSQESSGSRPRNAAGF